MWICRIAYLCVLVASTLFHVLYPYWFAWYLWVLVLLFLPFDLLISLSSMFTRRVSLSVPSTLEQGEEGELVITTLSERPFLPAKLRSRLFITSESELSRTPETKKRHEGKLESEHKGNLENNLKGQTISCRIRCRAQRGSRSYFAIDTSHSGVLHFCIKRLWVSSLLGLVTLPVPVSCETSALILPAPIKPPDTITLPRAPRLLPKPGGGFSEEHDLRPYRPGDPLNAMHWKLSAKHDSLITREPLACPPHNRLISLATWNTLDERDLILGQLRWSSNYLLEWGLPHFVAIGEQGTIVEIAQPEDLTAFLYRSLVGVKAGERLPAVVSPPTHFSWVLKLDARRVAP